MKEGDNGTGTFRRSDGQKVGKKMNLGQGQLVGWRGDTRRRWEVDKRKGRRKNREEVVGASDL